MLNHIGNCLPHYAQMLGCGVRGGVRVLVASRFSTLLYTQVVMKEMSASATRRKWTEDART